MGITNPKNRRISHARTEVLSVKVSAVEKYMILHAAHKIEISPSEFVRRVSMGASRNLGVKEPEITQSQEPTPPQGERTSDVEAEGEPPVAA